MADHEEGMTLVLNPNARRLKTHGLSVEDFKALLPPNSEVHLTQDLAELDEVMSNWRSGEQTLCFYGGDGSIARGITSFIRHHGEETQLPPVLPVRAGTINMLCNLMGRRETADTTLIRWMNRELREVREVPTVKVQVGTEAPRYGFILAWGVGYRVLSEYYSRTDRPSMMDAVAVMTQAFTQAVRPGNSESSLSRREHLALSVDGGPPSDGLFHTLTIGSIPKVSIGIRPFPPGEIKPGTIAFSANGMPLYQVANYAPTLLFGIGDQRQLDFGNELVSGIGTRELSCRLVEGFTMDGEIFELPEPAEVKVTAGPVVRFWVGREKFFDKLLPRPLRARRASTA
jgi:hypothetical protein